MSFSLSKTALCDTDEYYVCEDLYVRIQNGNEPDNSMVFYKKNINRDKYGLVLGELTNGRQKVLCRNMLLDSFMVPVVGFYTLEERSIARSAMLGIQDEMDKLVKSMTDRGLIAKEFLVKPNSRVHEENERLTIEVYWRIEMGRCYDIEKMCNGVEKENLYNSIKTPDYQETTVVKNLLSCYGKLGHSEYCKEKNFLGVRYSGGRKTVDCYNGDKCLTFIDVMYVRSGKSSSGACLPNRVYKNNSCEEIENPWARCGQASGLREACKKNGLKRYSKMNKSQMIELLMKL